MTDSEREAYTYDLATHYFAGVDPKGLLAISIDWMCAKLQECSDEELEAMYPQCALAHVGKKKRAQLDKYKPNGL